MIKISRRNYKQDVRMLSITNEHIYNITRKNPSIKEVVTLQDIIGICCTPFKDGFVCLHVKASHDDRVITFLSLLHACQIRSNVFIAIARVIG
jgi:hypothetical protein